MLIGEFQVTIRKNPQPELTEDGTYNDYLVNVAAPRTGAFAYSYAEGSWQDALNEALRWMERFGKAR